MTTEKDLIAREGYLYIFLSALLAMLLIWANRYLGVVGVMWFIFCVSFFRNPKRISPVDQGLIMCPADGTVIAVGKAFEPDFLKREMNRVTIFMSPFNVHVNRSPESGEVQGQVYHQGKYLAAFDERASDQNERSVVHIKTEGGSDVVFVQIAGWFARRIVTYVKKGDKLKRGQIFGVIKFGSRMDIYFPDGFAPRVELKQKVSAATTILAQKEI